MVEGRGGIIGTLPQLPHRHALQSTAPEDVSAICAAADLFGDSRICIILQHRGCRCRCCCARPIIMPAAAACDRRRRPTA